MSNILAFAPHIYGVSSEFFILNIQPFQVDGRYKNRFKLLGNIVYF